MFDSTKKGDELKALDELFDKVKTFNHSAEYKDLLDFIVKFKNLSPFNAFLIRTQNSGVKVVMNAKKWKKQYKRSVKPYARPLVILVPFGPVDFVYDIADTDGPPVPRQLVDPFMTTGTVGVGLYETVIKNLIKHGFTIDEYVGHKSLAGFVQSETGSYRIMLNKTWDINVKLSTLFHELGHLFAGHVGATQDCWWKPRLGLDIHQREFEAESISFLVCKRIGLETTSDEYLSNYMIRNEFIPKISFETVLSVAGYIEQMTESGFKPKKAKLSK